MRVGPPLRQLPPALRRAAIAPTQRRTTIPLTLRRPMIALAFRRPAIALSAVLTHGVFVLKLIAGVLAAGTVALAIMNNRDAKPAAPSYELASLAGNETVIFRRPSAPSTQVQDTAAAADENEQPVSYYRRAIQTIRFLNPSPRVALASATPESTRGLVKVHGFAAFAPKDAVEPDGSGSILRRDRKPSGGSAMDEVDDYLWEVYQRQPVKRDSTGDFTWKDPAAASRMGVSLQEYVIGGMDPGFREQLYRAGRAMDADGIQWSMLSAFRDDYRQRLASGFKARTGNSLHGGSRRTGGYGHGRAIDITTAEGNAEVVWHWLDVHGSKYGLQRPMPGNDPAHIQQAGEWNKISVAMHEARSRVAAASGGRHKRKVRFARR
jgi:hypothetical protein